MSTEPYRIAQARYRKGAVIVKPTSADGFKTPAHRLAENCGTWTNRESGYSMSAARAALFEKLYAAGWDGRTFGGLIKPDGTEWEGNARKNGSTYHVINTRVAKWPKF